MGLFSLFGGKKEKALKPGQLDEEIRIARERELEEVREAASLKFRLMIKSA